MKVRELIEILKTLPPEYEVIMSKDSEGNSFSPFADHGVFEYQPETTWYGNIYSKEDRDDEEEHYHENAVVLWPTN